MKNAAIFGYIALVFFLGHHDLSYSLLDHHALSAEVLEVSSQEGQLPRRLAFSALALFALTGVWSRGRNRLDAIGALGWLLCFFLCWSALSITWSLEPRLTFRRFGLFVILCLTALAVIRQHPVRFLPCCAFFVTSSYLLVGVMVEGFWGAFRPLSEGYRLAGTLHPNIQGTNCALMMLSAATLAACHRHRRWFQLAGGVAFVALILTKSRTSLLGVLCALVAFAMVRGTVSRPQKALALVLAASGLGGLLLAEFLGGSAASLMETLLLLGRTAEGEETFLGRLGIWNGCLRYLAQRPFNGYGFNSFWSPGTIHEFSDAIGIGINGAHSVYLELLLNLGVPGLVGYLLILCLGVKGAVLRYRLTGEAGYGFLFLLFIFTFCHGLLEGEAMALSFHTLLLLAGWTHLAFQSPEQEAAVTPLPGQQAPRSGGPEEAPWN